VGGGDDATLKTEDRRPSGAERGYVNDNNQRTYIQVPPFSPLGKIYQVYHSFEGYQEQNVFFYEFCKNSGKQAALPWGKTLLQALCRGYRLTILKASRTEPEGSDG
jgi:hypothetical protein